jgi:hypothetical protein
MADGRQSQPDPGAGNAQKDAATASDLGVYLGANWGRYSEAALREQALAQGHAPEAVDAAMAEVRARQAPVSARGRGVARTILIAYGATFLVLTAGMLLNTTYDDHLFSAGAGVFVLGIALVLGLVVSSVWVVSRRGFVVALGAVVALVALTGGFMAEPLGFVLLAVAAVFVVAGLAVRRTPLQVTSSTALLLSVPMLILLVVGGICVASGLPIPRPA